MRPAILCDRCGTAEVFDVVKELVLCDHDPEVLEAWRQQFEQTPGVEVREGDPLELKERAILVPGNSFGFLDRGLPLRACERFGFELQDQLQKLIGEEAAGELLIGQALVTEVEKEKLLIVYAPIWRSPQEISQTLNVHLATRAALAALAAREPQASRLVVPAMGVGDGGLHPLTSARQIRYAFEIHCGLRGPGTKNLTQIQRRERKLKAVPGAKRAERESPGS